MLSLSSKHVWTRITACRPLNVLLRLRNVYVADIYVNYGMVKTSPADFFLIIDYVADICKIME